MYLRSPCFSRCYVCAPSSSGMLTQYQQGKHSRDKKLDTGNLRSLECLKRSNMLQNHLNDVLISEFRVDHRVVERSTGPLRAEIVTNECSALGVHLGNQLRGLFLTLPECSD